MRLPSTKRRAAFLLLLRGSYPGQATLNRLKNERQVNTQ
jgi:hypothetical protein